MDIKVLASSSAGNCSRISDGHTALLLDAGITLKSIQRGLNWRVSELDGALITHAHGDHVKAAGALAKMGVDIYASQGTIDAKGLTGHRIHAIKALAEFTVGTFKILPFDIEHDAPEPLGFLVESKSTGEKLVYFTDTYYVRYRFTGLTHIMAECNYDEATLDERTQDGSLPLERRKRLASSHMSLATLLGFLAANDLSKVQEIKLLHMSDSNANELAIKEAIQRATGVMVNTRYELI
jgi:phosphoribosyl 1,2-cyclic phosphodiesterase